MIPRDPSSGFEEGLPDTTLYAITENLNSFYALTLPRMLLVALKSAPAPELPEPHDRQD
jgi:hypothetical protein